MAKKKDQDSSPAGKDKSKDKAKSKGKDEKPAPYSSIATHPGARMSVRRMKGWFGLGGFALAAVLSVQASVPLLQVGERALAAGVVGYMLAWWLSVRVWRHLIIAQQHAAAAEIERRRRDASEQRSTEAQPTA